MRTDGAPSALVVAQAMALASRSDAQASLYHSSNKASGSDFSSWAVPSSIMATMISRKLEILDVRSPPTVRAHVSL